MGRWGGMSGQKTENDQNGPVLNTDRELYREDTGDPAGSYYENSLHVTANGRIGMNVGGRVIVMPIADWHALAARPVALDDYDYTTADVRRPVPTPPQPDPKPDLWHAPAPGPDYWNWRCLRCSEPVADHPSWWQRLRLRFSPAEEQA